MEHITDDHFLTVEDLAQVTRLNKFTIYHLIKRNPAALPLVTRVWGRVLFKRSDVNRFIASIGQKAEAEKPARRGRGRPPKKKTIVVEIARKDSE